MTQTSHAASTINLERLEKLKPWVRQLAQEEILTRFNACSAQKKRDGSWLTDADLATHHRLQDLLKQHWPEIAFLSEEMHESDQADSLAQNSVWIVDPLDGTSNFAAGIPLFAFSMALVEHGQIQLAITYDPVRDELFSAVQGAGAFLNDEALICQSEQQDLSDCIAWIDFKRLNSELKQRLIESPPYGSQRNMGSCALEWCWMAANRGHLYLHGGMKLWDYAPGSLILKEAGGYACTLEQEAVFQNDLKPRSVIMASHAETFKNWRRWISEI